MGDRLLAVFQGLGYYHFATCNQNNNNGNVNQNEEFNGDIEGLWTYLYYSYSVEKNKAIAYIK